MEGGNYITSQMHTEEIKMLWGGGLDEYGSEDYLKLNVGERRGFRNQMLGLGGGGQNFRPWSF